MSGIKYALILRDAALVGEVETDHCIVALWSFQTTTTTTAGPQPHITSLTISKQRREAFFSIRDQMWVTKGIQRVKRQAKAKVNSTNNQKPLLLLMTNATLWCSLCSHCPMMETGCCAATSKKQEQTIMNTSTCSVCQKKGWWVKKTSNSKHSRIFQVRPGRRLLLTVCTQSYYSRAFFTACKTSKSTVQDSSIPSKNLRSCKKKYFPIRHLK